MYLRIVFRFKDCKLQFCGKRRLLSYFIVNPRTPASCQRRLLKLERKKLTLLILSLASFSSQHYSQQQRSPFRLFITRQKLSNALKSLKLKKVYRNRPIERASECHSPLGLGVFENPPEPDTKLRNSKECCVPTGSQVHAKATTFSENNGKRRR